MTRKIIMLCRIFESKLFLVFIGTFIGFAASLFFGLINNLPFPEILKSSGPWGTVGVILGFLLSFIPRSCDRNSRLKGCQASLRAEIKHCGKTACEYLGADVGAPLYRLPTIAWENAYSVLLAEGVFDEEQVESLHKYYNAVETLNRGLDQVNAAIGNQERYNQELGRLPGKAKNVSSCSDLYASAIKALDRL